MNEIIDDLHLGLVPHLGRILLVVLLIAPLVFFVPVLVSVEPAFV